MSAKRRLWTCPDCGWQAQRVHPGTCEVHPDTVLVEPRPPGRPTGSIGPRGLQRLISVRDDLEALWRKLRGDRREELSRARTQLELAMIEIGMRRQSADGLERK